MNSSGDEGQSSAVQSETTSDSSEDEKSVSYFKEFVPDYEDSSDEEVSCCTYTRRLIPVFCPIFITTSVKTKFFLLAVTDYLPSTVGSRHVHGVGVV